MEYLGLSNLASSNRSFEGLTTAFGGENMDWLKSVPVSSGVSGAETAEVGRRYQVVVVDVYITEIEAFHCITLCGMFRTCDGKQDEIVEENEPLTINCQRNYQLACQKTAQRHRNQKYFSKRRYVIPPK